jgi:protein phosphatase
MATEPTTPDPAVPSTPAPAFLVPDPSLVVLVGASGSGKTHFAADHFAPCEVVSSTACRTLVADDPGAGWASPAAHRLLAAIVAERLGALRLTVVDASSTSPRARQELLDLARDKDLPAVAIVFDRQIRTCLDRTAIRGDRRDVARTVTKQVEHLHRSLRDLEREGFRRVLVLRSDAEADGAVLERVALACHRPREHGPFDLVGPVHGCLDDLLDLLLRLGYRVSNNLQTRDPEWSSWSVSHPAGRRLVFLGDYVDHGPDVVDVLRLVMDACDQGHLALQGDHEERLLRHLRGDPQPLEGGLAASLDQFCLLPPAFLDRTKHFLDREPHLVLAGFRLVAAHAGLPGPLQGRASERVRKAALHGGLAPLPDTFEPTRPAWAMGYDGRAEVVYAHPAVPDPEWTGRTVNVDTGSVYGGRLTALRWPEREFVDVRARSSHAVAAARAVPAVPAGPPDDLVDLALVTGERQVPTRLASVRIRAGQAAAGLEMLRHTVDPRWLVYLPPTMSPGTATDLDGLLEHPREVFGDFRREGITRVVCQTKHMGSRAVVVACRDLEAARRRFNPDARLPGCIYTRTGRHFFTGRNAPYEEAVLADVRAAAEACNFWQDLGSDWMVLDCEVMPWNLKAPELIRRTYAATGAAADAALGPAAEALGQALRRVSLAPSRTPEEELALREADTALRPVFARFVQRGRMARQYVQAWQHYCWPVADPGDIRVAPFHLLASEGNVWADQDHGWQRYRLQKLCTFSAKMLQETEWHEVRLDDPEDVAAAIAWWEEYTGGGGEGMVVKPWGFVSRGPKGVVQPALKCRGKEYLRIIYGIDYDLPENLCRLRRRGTGGKRANALKEFALGIESLERFVRHEPLARVHEAVAGVLALESEPLDPRL